MVAAAAAHEQAVDEHFAAEAMGDECAAAFDASFGEAVHEAFVPAGHSGSDGGGLPCVVMVEAVEAAAVEVLAVEEEEEEVVVEWGGGEAEDGSVEWGVGEDGGQGWDDGEWAAEY